MYISSSASEIDREIVTENPLTNKLYVSDNKNNLLYEIDG